MENASPFQVSDLEVVVGLPSDSHVGMDDSKWSALGGIHWIIPNWRMQVTNMQFWAFSVPWNMSYSDSAGLPPMTNFSIPADNNPTNRNSNFELIWRSGKYQEVMAANVLFLHVSTNEVFIPFIAKMKQDTDSVWRLSISTNDFKELPK